MMKVGALNVAQSRRIWQRCTGHLLKHLHVRAIKNFLINLHNNHIIIHEHYTCMSDRTVYIWGHRRRSPWVGAKVSFGWIQILVADYPSPHPFHDMKACSPVTFPQFFPLHIFLPLDVQAPVWARRKWKKPFMSIIIENKFVRWVASKNFHTDARGIN